MAVLNLRSQLEQYTTEQLNKSGVAVIPDVDTISISELQNRPIMVRKSYERRSSPDEFFTSPDYLPGGKYYADSPWNWKDFPRNQLEKKGGYLVRRQDPDKPGKYKLNWWGRVVRFADMDRYLQTLQLITDPLDYIEYLKYAPLAGFNVKNTNPERKLPDAATGKWFKETITWYFLKTSFEILRAAQIQDLPDLQDAYNNTGKLVYEIIGHLNSPVTIDLNERLNLELEGWQVKNLQTSLNDVRSLIDENRKKMAQQAVSLSDRNAERQQTAFSTDPLSNPYLMYDPERSKQLQAPVFSDTARNLNQGDGIEVVGSKQDYQYWLQVPDFEKEHARVYQTDQGPMSMADMKKYGYTRSKVNWLPWLAAGAAVAYAASEVV